MLTWALHFTDGLWRNAVALVPLVLVVAAVCRVLPCRPATRHALWLFVLAWLVVPPFLPALQPDFKPWIADATDPGPLDAGKIDGRATRSTIVPVTRDDLASERKTIAPTPLMVMTKHRRVPESRDSRCEGSPASAARYQTPTPPWTVDPALLRAPKRLASAADGVGSLSARSVLWLRRSIIELFTRLDHGGETACPGSSSVLSAKDSRDESLHDSVAPLHIEFALPGEPADLTLAGRMTPSRAATAPTEIPDVGAPAPVISDDVLRRGAGIVDFAATPIPHEPAPASPSVESDGRFTWWIAETTHPWIVGLIEIRDSFGRLPSIPVGVWLGGITLLALCRILRLWRVQSVIRRSRPAGREIVHMVDRCARRIGLSRRPETRITADRLSPMIWCGLRGRLILPVELWGQLDDLGREAVVLHELAHLKRRDHWVLWMESLIGCLYWWHPVVWWVRRRLREEAENCCDAWVTWLLPKGRRAYAEALLATKQFVSDSTPTSAVGIGVISGRARRFARRLTMVMTQRSTPHMSVSGIALALAVGVAGWLSTPAHSGEKSLRSTTPAPSAPAVATAVAPVTPALVPNAPAPAAIPAQPVPPAPPAPPGTPNLAAHPTPPAPPAPPAPAHGEVPGVAPRALAVRPGQAVMPGVSFHPASPVTAGAFMVPSVQGPPDDRQRAVEERLERLERVLEKLESRLGGAGGSQNTAPRVESPRARGGTPQPAGDIVTEKYELSGMKLEKLTKLMIRDDVPIRVRPGDGYIEVQATPEDQMIFRAFIRMIDSREDSRAYRLSKGKLDDLSDLMVLDDVPVFVSPGEKEIRVQGNGAVQAVFEAFVKMIDPSAEAMSMRRGGDAERKVIAERELVKQMSSDKVKRRQAWANLDARQAQEIAEVARRKAQEKVAQELHKAKIVQRGALNKAARERENALQKAAEAMKQYKLHRSKHDSRELRTKIRNAEREAERLEKEAERLEKEADKLRDKADSLRSKAEATSDASQVASLEAEARQLEASAADIEAGMESLFAQVDQFQTLAAELEAMAEQVEESADAGNEINMEIDIDVDDDGEEGEDEDETDESGTE